jgi:hypothetical protein
MQRKRSAAKSFNEKGRPSGGLPDSRTTARCYFFIPESWRFFLYMAFSAAVGPPFGIMAGVIVDAVAAGAAAGFIACFFAKTADVERARIAKPTRIFFITLQSSQVKDATPRHTSSERPGFQAGRC